MLKYLWKIQNQLTSQTHLLWSILAGVKRNTKSSILSLSRCYFAEKRAIIRILGEVWSFHVTINFVFSTLFFVCIHYIAHDFDLMVTSNANDVFLVS